MCALYSLKYDPCIVYALVDSRCSMFLGCYNIVLCILYVCILLVLVFLVFLYDVFVGNKLSFTHLPTCDHVLFFKRFYVT
jgi:hypothetical protein